MSEHRFESTPFEIVALRDAVMLLQHIARSKISKWYLKKWIIRLSVLRKYNLTSRGGREITNSSLSRFRLTNK